MKFPAQIFYARLLLALAGGTFCAAISYFHWVQPLDRIFYDVFNEQSPMSTADDIVIVAMDERSLRELGRWPWPREKHVELLRKLKTAGVAAVAVDILFAEREANYPEIDNLLAEAISAQGAVVLPVFIARDYRGDTLREMLPIEPVLSAVAGLGHVHIEIDSDGVARSVYLREGIGKPRWLHLAVALNRLLQQGSDELPGVLNPDPVQGNDNSVIVRNNQNLIPFVGAAGSFSTVSYVDVMKDRVSRDALRGKIVLVGATAAGHVDNITTSLGHISGVEVNANILHALRSGKFASAIPRGTAALVVFIIAAFTVLFFTRLAPKQLLMAILSSAVLVPLLAFYLLDQWRLWMSPAPIVLTLFVVYPLWNWLRLDAAVDFIREQLEDLEQENRELAPAYHLSDAESAAAFLQSLGHLSSWEWAAAAPVDSGNLSGDKWLHENTCSSRVFVFDKEARRLHLYWNRGHESVACTLGQFFPELGVKDKKLGSGADVVNLNLLALDNAYAQARANRDLVKGTLEQLESGVILSLLSGEVLLINDQAKLLLGLDGGCRELLLALGGIALAEQGSIEDLVNRLIFQGLHFDYEGVALATGREILCRGGVINLERPMLLIVVTDVSDLKKSEKRRAEALNFLSHDLRAPLTSVLALIDSAKMAPAGGYDATLLNQIENYIEKNLSYAENFIQLAKLEHQDSQRFDDCDACSLIDNAVAQLFHTAKKDGVELRISYCDEPVRLQCNRSLVERALINLIDNALKHSAHADRIVIELTCDPAYAIFKVSDQGQGIASNELDIIFERFQQGVGAGGGVGLGLRFVSAVAKSHDGSISAENNTKGGACFVLRMPRQPLEA